MTAFSGLQVLLIVKSIVHNINSVSFYVKRVSDYINSEKRLTFSENDYKNSENSLTFSGNVPTNSEKLPAKSVIDCVKLENDYIIPVINDKYSIAFDVISCLEFVTNLL